MDDVPRSNKIKLNYRDKKSTVNEHTKANVLAGIKHYGYEYRNTKGNIKKSLSNLKLTGIDPDFVEYKKTAKANLTQKNSEKRFSKRLINQSLAKISVKKKLPRDITRKIASYI